MHSEFLASVKDEKSNLVRQNVFTANKDEDDVSKVLEGLRSLIRICGDEPEREGLMETPDRVLKAFLEYTSGLQYDPKDHLKKQFTIDYNDLVLVKDIEFHSICEHHFAPFFGVAHIAYFPNGKVTGLSKIARLVEGYANRFQVQERLTKQLLTSMDEVLAPKGVMVVIEAKHMCMCGRGIKKSSSSTVTSSFSGIFRDDNALRSELLLSIQKSSL